MKLLLTYTFDSAWNKFIDIMPKYLNSHFHDIMAYCCGFVAFILVMTFKNGIKNYNRKCVEKKYSYDLYRRNPVKIEPIMNYRIRNLIIPIIGAIISVWFWGIVANLSDRIEVKEVWFFIAPLVPIAVYTMYEFLESGIVGWLLLLLITVLVFKGNYDYCCEFEEHHKICYAVRLLFVVFGILGFILQILPSWHDFKKLMRERRANKKAVRNNPDGSEN